MGDCGVRGVLPAVAARVGASRRATAACEGRRGRRLRAAVRRTAAPRVRWRRRRSDGDGGGSRRTSPVLRLCL
ncbi:hypothetical protein E2562_000152 [Oryza meyeriana var. granulata]|uniref:Uncharacterized protein n=1 Tax=Oryza meyeriana var. granulata TaxID=110450 RepID=A0A6G1DAT4_9ORYZ|nr:hypothetical protein E2562_000152 [Oryza meyeriana var. granulata]